MVPRTSDTSSTCAGRHSAELVRPSTEEVVSILILSRCAGTTEERGRTTAASSTTGRWRRCGCGQPTRWPGGAGGRGRRGSGGAEPAPQDKLHLAAKRTAEGR